jgi:hypothetical protein
LFFSGVTDNHLSANKQPSNPKHEIRNSKQIAITKAQNSKLATKYILPIQSFEFSICFTCLREAAPAKAGVSIFGFRILTF